MNFRVVIVTNDKSVEQTTLDVIKDAGIEVEHIPCDTEEKIIKAGKNADVLLVGTTPNASKNVMDSLPKLKMIGRSGVGVDSVDISSATELGICVTNTPGINTTEVADHAMALLLSITRNITELTSKTSKGEWTNNRASLNYSKSKMERIAGKTIGIIGFGNIGRAFATRIRGFGPSKIIAYDPFILQTSADLYGVQLVEFDYLLEESDIITVHAPSTDQTKHMFNTQAFNKMKDTAIFINCARGLLVDEMALQKALDTGEIFQAGIDVTEIEPISEESPLLKLENLKITPHFAGWSRGNYIEQARRYGENAVNVLSGKPLHGLANPDVLKTIAIMRDRGSNKWDEIPDPNYQRGY